MSFAASLQFLLYLAREPAPLGQPDRFAKVGPGSLSRSKRSRVRGKRCQFSRKRCELSPKRYQFFSKHCQFFPKHCQLSSRHCQFFSKRCQLSSKRCQLSPKRCQLSPKRCQLSPKRCQLSPKRCQLSPKRCQFFPKRCQFPPQKRQFRENLDPFSEFAAGFHRKPSPISTQPTTKPVHRTLIIMTKAIIDFSGYTGPDLLPTSQTIHDNMDTNATTFTTPPLTMAAFQGVIDPFEAALQKKASKATADIIAFNVARNDLETALFKLGNYVNTTADGDPSIVVKSGFPSYETTPRTADTTPPAAPQNLAVRQGDLSGTLVARYQPDRPRSINDVQTNTGDPNKESDWKPAGMFSGGKANLAGFTPGTVVWVRVRTVGLKGVMGAWSDPAKIMVV
jgi:hypothetical protein